MRPLPRAFIWWISAPDQLRLVPHRRQAGASRPLPRALAGRVSVVSGQISCHVCAFACNVGILSGAAHDLKPTFAATAFRYVAVPSTGEKINLVTCAIRECAWGLQVNDTVSKRAHEHETLRDVRRTLDKGRATALQNSAGANERSGSVGTARVINGGVVLNIALQATKAARFLRSCGTRQNEQQRQRKGSCKNGLQSRHGSSYPVFFVTHFGPLVSLPVRRSWVERDRNPSCRGLSDGSRLGSSTESGISRCRSDLPQDSDHNFADLSGWSAPIVRSLVRQTVSTSSHGTGVTEVLREYSIRPSTTWIANPSKQPCCFATSCGYDHSGVDDAHPVSDTLEHGSRAPDHRPRCRLLELAGT